MFILHSDTPKDYALLKLPVLAQSNTFWVLYLLIDFMKKVELMRELISLIKQIKNLGKWEHQQGLALQWIHAKWLKLLKESPAHRLTLTDSLMIILKEDVAVTKADIKWETATKFTATRYEKAKENLIACITEHIKNPD